MLFFLYFCENSDSNCHYYVFHCFWFYFKWFKVLNKQTKIAYYCENSSIVSLTVYNHIDISSGVQNNKDHCKSTGIAFLTCLLCSHHWGVRQQTNVQRVDCLYWMITIVLCLVFTLTQVGFVKEPNSSLASTFKIIFHNKLICSYVVTLRRTFFHNV